MTRMLILLGLASLLAACSAARTGSAPLSPRPEVLELSAGDVELREEFNARSDRLRLLVILSPT